MLDALLIIILQSWGFWPPSPGGSDPDLDADGPGGQGPGRGREVNLLRLTEEEAAEILRILHSFSGWVETPEPRVEEELG